MKAIFTGTEQDLIECGFKRDKRFIYPKYVTRAINKEEELQVCIEKPRYNIWDGKDKNHSMEIWLYNNKKHCGTCDSYYIDKSLIQDLIDKNLVKWE